MKLDQVTALVLAAGKGSRMKSDLPKVLHEVNGKPMLARVLDTIYDMGIEKANIVLGRDIEPFQALLEHYPNLGVAQQLDQKGTAHAVASAAKLFSKAQQVSYAQSTVAKGNSCNHEYILITTGDTPCLEPDGLKHFVEKSLEASADISVLGMEVPDSFGYGRLILDKDNIGLLRIVEEKDASETQKEIHICNSGIVFAKVSALFTCLEQIQPNNAQGEYYLTDSVAIGNNLGMTVTQFTSSNWQQFAGINTPEQLQKVSSYLATQ